MSFASPPATAAWQHREVRAGFEVVYFERRRSGYRISGSSAAVEAGKTWVVDYEIDVDAGWITRAARIAGRSAEGTRRTLIEADGAGEWHIDGDPAPHLEGCLDVDLESSVMTNALPVRRMTLAVGQQSSAAAAYVGALGLTVERLEQTYRRIADQDGRQCYHYAAPVFDFACRLVYDQTGLVLDYPGIAVRAG